MPEIKFTIKPDGTIEQHVMKAKGKACLRLTARLEKELGQVVKRQLRSEYYEEPREGVAELLRQKNTL
jgi:hypothetical protein